MLACWLFAFDLLLPWIPYCVQLEDYIVQSPYDDPRYQLLGIIMKVKIWYHADVISPATLMWLPGNPAHFPKLNCKTERSKGDYYTTDQ